MDSVRVLTPQYAPSDEELEAAAAFASLAGEAGWIVNVEWYDPPDSVDGEEVDGFFHWFLSYEASADDDRVHAYHLDFGSVPESQAQMLMLLSAAQDGWRRYLEDAQLAERPAGLPLAADMSGGGPPELDAGVVAELDEVDSPR